MIVMLTVAIDRNLEDPVYEQIADQVRRLVASGDLSAGTALPAVRQLAVNLGVNLNTVARAYRLLEDEGFLKIRDRSGVVVAAPAEDVEDSARETLLNQLQTTIARLRQAGMGIDEILLSVQKEVRALSPREGRNCDG